MSYDQNIDPFEDTFSVIQLVDFAQTARLIFPEAVNSPQ